MSDDEYWTTSAVQRFLGYRSAAAARVWLRRCQIVPARDSRGFELRDPGSGEKLYQAAAVREKHAGRPRPTYRRREPTNRGGEQ